jgi:DNA (cytosine-5)-methyltransferase 1
MATFISAVGPKAFVFENVRGLLSSKWTRDGRNGEVWDDVRATLEGITWTSGAGAIGYTVHPALVRARDYGVPQNRPRIIVVGVRNDLEFEPVDGAPAAGLVPLPTRVGPDIIDALGDLVDPDWHPGMRATESYPHPARSELQRRFRTYPGQVRAKRVGAAVTDHEYSRHSAVVQARFEALRQLGRHGLPQELLTKKFAQRVLPERWGPGGPNITVASLADDYVHFDQARSLTVREWARLQTFPDWYQFVGKRTTGGRRRAGDPEAGDWTREVPKYTQIGNAVPVLLAEAIGTHLNKVLGECEGTLREPAGLEERLSA